MRFSAAIHQIVARERAPALPTDAPDVRESDLPEVPGSTAVQEPPADLDQRVRLSGEW